MRHLYVQNIVERTATNITRGLGWQLDLLGTVTVTLNYSVHTLQFTVHWLPVFQHRKICSPSELTATASLTELGNSTPNSQLTAATRLEY
jgi:hypothetical protein